MPDWSKEVRAAIASLNLEPAREAAQRVVKHGACQILASCILGFIARYGRGTARAQRLPTFGALLRGRGQMLLWACSQAQGFSSEYWDAK
jgi:hypothetical protein